MAPSISDHFVTCPANGYQGVKRFRHRNFPWANLAAGNPPCILVSWYFAFSMAVAPDHIPCELVAQLAPGGRMVIPVGRMRQHLMVIKKHPDGSTTRNVVIAVRFVPRTGDALK